MRRNTGRATSNPSLSLADARMGRGGGAGGGGGVDGKKKNFGASGSAGSTPHDTSDPLDQSGTGSLQQLLKKREAGIGSQLVHTQRTISGRGEEGELDK